MKVRHIFFLALIICPMGCDTDEFFALERPQETQWINTVTFEQGLASAYYSMLYYAAPGYQEMVDFASSGVAQLLPETSTGAPWNEMYYRQFDDNYYSHARNYWRDNYRAITLSNLAITLDEEEGGNPFDLKVDDTDYTDNYVRQIGEYHFVRAYSYYQLIRYFAPPYDHNGSNDAAYIPFKTTVPTSKEEIFAEELGSNEVIYQQIISDLLVAKSKLPRAYNSATMIPTYEVGRANYYVTTALLAKVYFLMGMYNEALEQLDEIIQSAEVDGVFAMEEPIEAFNKNVITDIPKESIWEFNSGDPSVNGTALYMYWGWLISLQDRNADDFGRGEGISITATNQFTFSYEALDKMGWMVDPLNGNYELSQEAQDDLRFQQLHWYLLPYQEGGDSLIYETVPTHFAVDRPQLYLDKYYRGGPGDGRYTKFPIIRLAEMYLIRSWIRWNAGDPVAAAEDLNNVWNRANPENPNRYTSGTVNHEAIYSEFLKEMSGEGWTLDFMISTQMNIPAGDEDRAEIAPPYSEWHWVIPSEEVNLNPDLQ